MQHAVFHTIAFLAFSCLAFSTLAVWCRIFMSRNFMSRIFSVPGQTNCSNKQTTWLARISRRERATCHHAVPAVQTVAELGFSASGAEAINCAQPAPAIFFGVSHMPESKLLCNGATNALNKLAAKIAKVCCDTIRYDTRCYFNVRSKADMNRLNLPHGDYN